jgi:hypothetical protein
MDVQQPPVPTGYEAAQQLVEALVAAGINATCDPRAALPPCVLVPPPVGDFQQGMCSQWCSFDLYVLAPGTGNSDAFRLLEWLAYWTRKALPNITGQYPTSYSLTPDSPTLPAYRLPIEIGV